VSTDSPYVRIAPDPVAEHLAARGYVQQFGGDDSAWRIFLAQLKKAQNPAGFVTALLACVHERTYGTRVSDLMRQRFAGIAAAPPKDRDAA
jgi:hypothetical protein